MMNAVSDKTAKLRVQQVVNGQQAYDNLFLIASNLYL
jgi:hypothetical protein